MLKVIDATAQFPTVIFTSALMVVVGFWLLVPLGRADIRAFDADVPSLARTLSGTPVFVAASIVIASAWLVSLAGTILLDSWPLTGFAGAVARLALLALSTLAAWPVTRGLTVPLARLFIEPGPYLQDSASGAPFDPGSRRSRS